MTRHTHHDAGVGHSPEGEGLTMRQKILIICLRSRTLPLTAFLRDRRSSKPPDHWVFTQPFSGHDGTRFSTLKRLSARKRWRKGRKRHE